MPDVVVFDLFDTLVDLRREDLPLVDWGEGPRRSTVGALHALIEPLSGLTLPAFAEALRAADEEFLRARWAEDREITTEQRFEHLLARMGLASDGLVDRLTAAHVGWLARAASTPAHHREVLGRLRARCRLAICSNYSHTPNALHILERDGLREYFDVVVVSADVGLRKPHPRIFERVFDELGVPMGDALHVGDSLAKDVAGAAPLGLETVWITRRIADPEAARAGYDGPSPDHVVADLREIEALLG
jgi:HAD superfamily hydrolase (TIGR01509 family)